MDPQVGSFPPIEENIFVGSSSEIYKNKFGYTSTYLYGLMMAKRRRTIVCTNCFVKCAETQTSEHNLNEKSKC